MQLEVSTNVNDGLYEEDGNLLQELEFKETT